MHECIPLTSDDLSMVLIYRSRYRAYSLLTREFQGTVLALRSTLQREHNECEGPNVVGDDASELGILLLDTFFYVSCIKFSKI